MTVWEDVDGDLTGKPESQMDEATARFMCTVIYIDSLGRELAPEASESDRREIAIDYINSVMNE